MKGSKGLDFMCKLSAEELYERLTDKYGADEIVEVLGIETEDLKDMGIIQYIEDNLELLTNVFQAFGAIE